MSKEKNKKGIEKSLRKISNKKGLIKKPRKTAKTGMDSSGHQNFAVCN